LCVALGAELVLAAELRETQEDAEFLLRELIADGSALATFRGLIGNQGGDVRVLDEPERLPAARRIVEVPAPSAGYVHRLDALAVGHASSLLGAGRFVKDAQIDHAVGVELLAKVGDAVAEGAVLARLHINAEGELGRAQSLVSDAYSVRSESIPEPPLILERVPR
jgi:pyrimidine-nucleoside phosphorylase